MSEVKVNKISPRSGTDVTLGDSGDTFTIPSGATINNQGTAVNFGATGSASWVTTVKTSTFTAVAGEGYFINTTGGVVSVNLPAGTAGAVVAVKDYAKTFDTNNVTLVPNGSDKIGGQAINATLSTEGLAVTLVFIDSTQGWLVTDSGLQDEAPTALYMTATGGSVTTDGSFKVHSFTGPGTFTVCSVGNASGSNEVSYMVVAGGGGGGGGAGSGYCAGGAGAGGYREGKTPQCTYTSSPITCTSGSNNGLPVSVQGYPIVVGGGGAGAPGTQNAAPAGGDGNVSSFSTITSTGGGGGGSRNTPSGGVHEARDGGSGGGAGQADNCAQSNTFGAGNTPPVSPSQGFPGGRSAYPTGSPSDSGSGGGGGAGAVGGNSTPGPTNYGGNGGAGVTSSIDGTPTARAGGGGGSGYGTPGALGGTGGGGKGSNQNHATESGTANTGGGGGGGSGASCRNGGTGGSGMVIIRYKFQA